MHMVQLHLSEGLLQMAKRLLLAGKACGAMVEIKIYRCKEGIFGSTTARAAAKRVAFDWWRDVGVSAPTLKELAMKLLSQVESACSFERSWSHYGFIHNRLRNRLTPEHAKDRVYVFVNLRLLRKLDTREDIEHYLGDLKEDM